MGFLGWSCLYMYAGLCCYACTGTKPPEMKKRLMALGYCVLGWPTIPFVKIFNG